MLKHHQIIESQTVGVFNIKKILSNMRNSILYLYDQGLL